MSGSWTLGGYARGDPPIGEIYEIQQHGGNAAGRLLVKLTRIGAYEPGTGRRGKAILLVGESREDDARRGEKVRLLFGTGTGRAEKAGPVYVHRSRTVSAEAVRASRHWARRLAGRLQEVDQLRAEARGRVEGAAAAAAEDSELETSRRSGDGGGGEARAAATGAATPRSGAVTPSRGLPPAASALASARDRTVLLLESSDDEKEDEFGAAGGSALPGVLTSADLARMTLGQLLELRAKAGLTEHVKRAIDQELARAAGAVAPVAAGGDAPPPWVATLLEALGKQGSKRKRGGHGGVDESGSSDESDGAERVRGGDGKSIHRRNQHKHAKYPGLLAKETLARVTGELGEDVMGEISLQLDARALKRKKLTELKPLMRMYARVRAVPALGPNLRARREIETLALVLDALVLGRPDVAADVAAQRIKAVEMSARDGNWDRAQWLELIAPNEDLLATREEQHGAQRDKAAERRANQVGELAKKVWRKEQPAGELAPKV